MSFRRLPALPPPAATPPTLLQRLRAWLHGPNAQQQQYRQWLASTSLN